jgi:hypothetical protein
MTNTETPMCQARDLLAVDGPRTHDFPDESGKLRSITFEPRRFVAVPMDVAMILVGNEGFEVRDPNGTPLKVQKHTGPVGNQGIVLRPDEVVAKLDELSTEALLERAKRFPEGGKLKKADGRAALISFILSAGVPQQDLDNAPAGSRLGALASVD